MFEHIKISIWSIPRSIHIDYYLENFKDELSKLDKSKRTIVYCAVGGRSAKACEIMVKMGFEDVYNMEGGIDGWNVRGKKVFVPEEYRKMKFLIFAIGLFFITSCVHHKIKYPHQESFFPIDSGNVWVYVDSLWVNDLLQEVTYDTAL